MKPYSTMTFHLLRVGATGKRIARVFSAIRTSNPIVVSVNG